MTRRMLLAASTAVLLSSLPAFAATPPYSAIYSFGDSLSDVGNIFLATPIADPPTPHQPVWPYSEGRFSNGAVWVQDLSVGLGMGPVTPSLLGGNDYAFGGATTGTTKNVHAATPIDLPDQVGAFQAYLSAHPTAQPSTALFTLSIGANDIFALLKALASEPPVVDPTSVIDEAAANLAAAVGQLQLDGAKHLVLFDVPNLGLTPAFNSTLLGSETATGLAAEFNAQVQADLVPAETSGLKIYDLNAFDKIGEAVAGAYGFANVTDPCWTGTLSGGISSGTLCSDTLAGQDQYLFWDDVHPTAGGHLLVANDALEQLGFPPVLAPAPEPSTWAMMLFGFAGLGALGARKVRAAARVV